MQTLKLTDPVPTYKLPIGFSRVNGREPTVQDVVNWREREKPNVVQEVSYLTLGGFIASAVGGLLAFLQGKNSNGGAFSGFLALVGLATTGVGYYLSRAIYNVSGNKKNTEPLPNPNTSIQNLIEDLRNKNFKADHRVKIIKDISTLPNKKEAKDALIECLNDDSKQVREAAVNVLSEVIDAQSLAKLIKPLRENLASSGDEHVEKKKDVIKLLTKCLKDIKEDEAQKVRLEAIDALVQLKETSTLKLFFELLQNPNENKEVKTKLFHAIGELADKDTKIGHKSIKTVLKELEENEKDDDISKLINDLIKKLK